MEQLREKLELDEGKYQRYSRHLKNRILLYTQAELEAKTDIKFTFEEIKKGTKVVKIVFYVTSNAKLGPEGVNDTEFIDHEDTIQLFARFEVAKKVANSLIKTYGEEQIRSNIKYVYEKKRNAEVTNMAGYIVKAIEENYADTQKSFEPEDEQDMETAVSCMNERIRKFIFFKERCVQEEIMNEVEGTQQMIKSITDDILRVIEKRKLKNLRPLEEADFEDEWGKSALRQILQDM